METLCSRFYAVVSGMIGDIDMGSSGECLESKNWQFFFFFLHLMTFFVTLTFDQLEERHQLSDFLGVAE